ncbi:MAG: hypothetical protein AVO39_11040 [delta proteobacterium MLS_D]|nr:MAG: hypothetical protein AVO39_11040 [delta proteobacterium MLS_D]
MRYVLFDTYISMLFQPFFSDIAAKAASMWTSVATPPGSIWQSLNTLLYNQLMNNYFIQFFNEVISGANNMWKSIYGSGKGVSTKINGVNYNMPGGGPTSPPITNPTPTPSGPPGSTYLPGYPKYESDTDMLKWKIDKIWDTLKDEYNLSAVELGTLQEMHDNYLYTYGNTDSGPISFNVNDIPGKSDQQKLIDWLVTKGYWDYLNTNPGAAYHTGGMISNEGLFLGLSGEGVLNRMAMSNIGSEGLRRLNAGGSVGNTMYITIQAWDGEDVERVFENRIIPMLKRTSEAGVEVIHESGIRYAMR